MQSGIPSHRWENATCIVYLKKILWYVTKFKNMTNVSIGTVAYPRKISQNQFYQLLHIGKWRCTIAVPNVGTAGVQDCPNRNPSVNNILTHSKQYAVEMISKLDRLNIKKGKAMLTKVSKPYKSNVIQAILADKGTIPNELQILGGN